MDVMDLPRTAFRNERAMLTAYVGGGYNYNTILQFLAVYHDCHWSLSTLKRRLRQYGLGHRLHRAPLREVQRAIRNELRGPRQNIGYRSMCRVLRQEHGLSVSRNVVMTSLSASDPNGSQSRRTRTFLRREYHSKGPNETWHADGYDKLKPWGFCVHGAIDGYSRKVLWLEACATNNDPAVIATYFLNAVGHVGTVPKTLVTDLGTENGVIGAMNCYLRRDDYAHRFVSSVRNQRIESWWSFLRRNHTQWWIDFFNQLYNERRIDPDHPFKRSCLQYFVMPFLQRDLQAAKTLWNTHYIRESNSPCPGGIPDRLFYLPHLDGGIDQGTPTTEEDLAHLRPQAAPQKLCDDPIVHDYIVECIERSGLAYPQTIDDSVRVYEQVCAIALR